MRSWGFLGTFFFFVTAQAAEYPAWLDWGRRVELGTLVSGVVSRVEAEPGQGVKAGELLVQLDQRQFMADLKRARAMLARAQSRFEEAEREAHRARELYDRTLLSDHELQKARLALDEAAAEKAAARGRLVEAQLAMERSEIRAPFTGVLLQVLAYSGQPLQNRFHIQPLVVLADQSFLRARAWVPLYRVDAGEVRVKIRDEWHEPQRVVSGVDFRSQADQNRFLLEVWLSHAGRRLSGPVVIELGER